MSFIPTPKDAPEPVAQPPQPKPLKALGELARENGLIFLTKKFNEENITPIIHQIIDINLQSEKPEVITLYINSPGLVTTSWSARIRGEVASAFQLIDTMKYSRIPVSTIATGQAASCGVLTLMAGVKGKRYITENTTIMSHQYSWGSKGKEHELMAKMKAYDFSTERMLNHYKKCTGKSESYIRKNLLSETDHWLSPKEAVRHGIADKVLDIY